MTQKISISKEQKDKVRLACEWDQAIRAERHRASEMQRDFGPYRNLSELVTAARKIQQKHDECWLEFDTIGISSDCGPIVARHQKTEWRKFYESVGVSEQELEAMVTARTTERWAYFNLPLQ